MQGDMLCINIKITTSLKMYGEKGSHYLFDVVDLNDLLSLRLFLLNRRLRTLGVLLPFLGSVAANMVQVCSVIKRRMNVGLYFGWHG